MSLQGTASFPSEVESLISTWSECKSSMCPFSQQSESLDGQQGTHRRTLWLWAGTKSNLSIAKNPTNLWPMT